MNSDKILKAEFDYINLKYFSGVLPSVPVYFNLKISTENIHGRFIYEVKEPRIEIELGTYNKSERSLFETLVHEMTHLYQLWIITDEHITMKTTKDIDEWMQKHGKEFYAIYTPIIKRELKCLNKIVKSVVDQENR